MAYKMFKRERERRLKAKRFIKLDVGFFGYCSDSPIYRAAFPRWTFKPIQWFEIRWEAELLQRTLPDSIIFASRYWRRKKKEHFIRYGVGYGERTGAPFRKQVVTWMIQEQNVCFKFNRAIRTLHRSKTNWGHKGTTFYKDKYTCLRRSETRRLEQAAVIGDEEAFDRIAPDGWRGAISWDIW